MIFLFNFSLYTVKINSLGETYKNFQNAQRETSWWPCDKEPPASAQTQVQSLIRSGPTWCGAVKPMHHSY